MAHIAVAGATGRLGGKIVRALLAQGAEVTALVRPDSKVDGLEGARLERVQYEDVGQLAAVLRGASCVVSALSGLREVIVDAQSVLLHATVQAGCHRFIPSDFALDFYRLPEGHNRNFDLRREFARRLDQAPVAATSILNGAFSELLLGDAPFLIHPLHRVLAWGDRQPPLDFTTMDDTAWYTAQAAMAAQTPRTLRIAGDRVTAAELAAVASELSGKTYRVLDAGSLKRLELLIRVARLFDLRKKDVFPPWQGMQYMRDQFDGRGLLEPLDNDRFGARAWTSVRQVLAEDPRLAPGKTTEPRAA